MNTLSSICLGPPKVKRPCRTRPSLVPHTTPAAILASEDKGEEPIARCLGQTGRQSGPPAGAFLNQDAPLLTAAEERALALRIKSGDQAAREALIVANLRLVIRIASAYQSRGATLDDLIQEGNRGLMRAAEHYDPQAHNSRFASYASFWIRCMIQRAVTANFSLIRVPDYIFRLRSRLDRAVGQAREGASTEVQPHSGVPLPAEVASRMRISNRRLGHIYRSFTECRSYNATDEVSEEGCAGAIPDSHRPDVNLERIESISALYRAMEILTPFEAWLIRHRFGLANPHAKPEAFRATSRSRAKDNRNTSVMTRKLSALDNPEQVGELKEIGSQRRASYVTIARAFGIPTTRVRQIEQAALEKLRARLEGSFGSESAGPVVSSVHVRLSD
jgi:RNA polymerase primary sigma factor